MNRKENIIIGILFVFSGILITFSLNTVTMITALLIIAATAVHDIYKKPAFPKILFYIIVFAAFSAYIVLFI
ncbi:hypothetical protein [Oceanobacillus neutriphilus]|uniref:DUF3953 domain-containing protein n=1 Tax=Oceanobacillus neutriphilus TaxID=531815 RepID=A0ABQ2NXR1_9BACI|nr:hypothetical protein [Oceanobacillus neutriphilus]GGP13071.1 hypothetical protein GCM10011346_31580 [Oceanobacillus neutriphilus]